MEFPSVFRDILRSHQSRTWRLRFTLLLTFSALMGLVLTTTAAPPVDWAAVTTPPEAGPLGSVTTATVTPTPTASTTASATLTATPTASPTGTLTVTTTGTSEATPTGSLTPSVTATGTATATPTATLTPTASPTPTTSPTPASPWEKDEDNPVVEAGDPLDWDGAGVTAPSVIADGNLFHMWYTGQVATGTSGVVTAIGYATSSAGTPWVKYVNNPVLADGPRDSWDAGGAAQPVVIKNNDMYQMWYAGRDETGIQRIGYATSGNGRNWTKFTGNPLLEPGAEGTWDEQGVIPGAVLRIRGIYRMWFTGLDAEGIPQIGWAISPDGIRWAKHDSGNPVLAPAPGAAWEAGGVYRPTVLFDGMLYRMWYTGIGEDGIHRIGFAHSTDGVTWMRGPNNPVLYPGQPGAWDADHVAQPVVLRDPDRRIYHMWYAGSAAGLWQIGYATRPSHQIIYLPLVIRN